MSESDNSGNTDGDFTMLEAGISIGLRQRPLEWITADFLIGVGYHDLSLSLRSSSATGNEDIGRFGALAGGRVAAHFADWSSAYLRGSILLLPALAMVTDHLGLIATASTTFEPPYTVARRFASLAYQPVGYAALARTAWRIAC